MSGSELLDSGTTIAAAAIVFVRLDIAANRYHVEIFNKIIILGVSSHHPRSLYAVQNVALMHKWR